MKRITLLIFLSAFLLLRPYNFAATGQMYTGDDWSYFAHASALAFGQFPSYAKESWQDGEGVPLHSPGAGVMAAPFVYLFLRIDLLCGHDIIAKRTPENIPGSWSLFGFIVATSVYFWLACLFLFLSARMYTDDRAASWAVISMVLVQGAPLFAFRRPVFSHISSLLLLSFLVWLCCRMAKLKQRLSVGRMCLVGVVCGLVVLTRLNNALLAAGCPFIVAWQFLSGKKLYQKAWAVGAMLSLTAAVVIIFKIWPESMFAHQSLGGVDRLQVVHPLDYYGLRFRHILFGPDWGLVFTAPFVVVSLVWVYVSRRQEVSVFKWLCPVLLVNLWVVMQWNTQGGWYGYRYLFFTAAPILTVPWAVFLQGHILKAPAWRRAVIVLLSVPPLLSMLFFEGNSTGLTLKNVTQYFGVIGWGNNTYQWEVWKTLLFSPVEACVVVCKGGVLYLVYLFCHAFSLEKLLPAVVGEKYAAFQWAVLVKTFVIYCLPLLMYALWRRFERRPS